MYAFAVRTISILLFGSLIGNAAPIALDAQQSIPVAQQRAIEAAARKELRAYGGKSSIPGVFIAIWIPGKAPYVKSVGYADVATKAPFELGDHFRIGSNTKTFVVTVLLQLQDEHKLRVDDPISKFNIGVKVPNGNHITIRQLAEMRSGLFEAYNTPQASKARLPQLAHVTPQTLVRWAVAEKPLFAPGARWNYSNTNYIILGLIIEAVTHDTVGNQIRKRLLQPMGLSGTSFPDTTAMPTPYAHGYDQAKSGAWTDDVSTEVPPTLTWAAGAMISTVPDMKRWVKAYVRGTVNTPASQRDRLRCIPIAPGSKLEFGMGIGCTDGWYGYTGGLPGYHTAAYYLPSKDITVIAFVTAQVEKPSPGTANSIVKDISQIITPGNILFSQPMPVKKPGSM